MDFNAFHSGTPHARRGMEEGRDGTERRARGPGRSLSIVAATVTVLTSCATTSWTVPEGGEQQFRRDIVACQLDAATASPAPRPAALSPFGFVHPTSDYTMAPQGLRGQLGTASGELAQRSALVDSCMEAKGHRRQ
jgi:hypothetical protein